MERGLSPQLEAKLAAFAPSQPYVWQLRLTETDFAELEAAICLLVWQNGGGHAQLLTEAWAAPTVVYLAEWYKRRYQSGGQPALSLDSGELEQLWAAAGISTKIYLYTDEGGNRRWRYSTYVLGGLAIRHELGRNDRGRFLKGLCRLYHGENFTLENLDDASRAVAFRESIRQQHSLYAYMRDILDGRSPFDDDELANPRSEVSRFVAAVKAANDEVLRQKFRFEWIVGYRPEQEYMTRRLLVWLTPEEVGGGLHQYLRHDRLHQWGIAHPEEVESLKVGIRFLDGDREVLAADFGTPLFAYSNTGEAATGFVCWNTRQCAPCKRIPACHFSRWQMVVQDNNGREYVVQEQTASEYMQLWRTDEWGDEWSSRQSSQRQTALVFSRRCHLTGEDSIDVDHKPFYTRNLGQSDIYGWHYIYDRATLTDERGRELTFYNRQDYDVATTRLYADTLRYVQGGLVRHFFVDDPDVEEGPVAELLPLIFGRRDIVVRHFATKDDVKEACPVADAEAELIEWQQPNGRYAVWSDGDGPQWGVVVLRITVKGQCLTLRAVLLPPLNEHRPIERDLERQTVAYSDFCTGEPRLVQDYISLDHQPAHPTLAIRYGTADDYTELDIYRPFRLQEICMAGRVLRYGQGGTASIPYVLKQELTYNEFGVQGYRSYDCALLGSIYPLLGEAANAHMAAWSRGQEFEAQSLDAEAPASLRIVFGTAENGLTGTRGLTFLKWDYDKDKAPVVAAYERQTEKNTVLFQSLETVDETLTVAYARVHFSPFTYRAVAEKTSALACFEVAMRHRVYFFVFTPLAKLQQQEFATAVYRPLMEKRDGHLTEADRLALRRLADEFQFSWADLNVDIND